MPGLQVCSPVLSASLKNLKAVKEMMGRSPLSALLENTQNLWSTGGVKGNRRGCDMGAEKSQILETEKAEEGTPTIPLTVFLGGCLVVLAGVTAWICFGCQHI